ncbi:hypothetical protein BGX29_005635 [Mortierella sp. GBA35]|nr:hypothetical protein BGX29_005635 [Mortierella sp. GBA35]
MESPSEKVFSIPELVNTIGRHLDRKSVHQLCKTSRILHQAFAPQFWHTLELSRVPHEQKFFKWPEPQQALARNMQHVRQFKVRAHSFLDMVDSMARNDKDYNAKAVPIFNYTPISLPSSSSATTTAAPQPTTATEDTTASTTTKKRSPLGRPFDGFRWLLRLQGTSLFHFQYMDDRQPEEKYGKTVRSLPSVMPQLAWVLFLNPSLTSVRLYWCHFKNSLETRVLVQALSSLVSLKDLDLRLSACTDKWDDVFPALFYGLPASLESLILYDSGSTNVNAFEALSDQVDKDQTGNKQGQPLPKREGPLTRLKSLRIESVSKSTVGLWDSRATKQNFPGSGTLIQLVLKHCPRLRGLDGCSQGTIGILKALPKNTLESFTSQGPYNYDDLNNVVSKVSQDHRESIKEIRMIRIDDHNHLRSGIVINIVCYCTALEDLSIKGGDLAATRLANLSLREWGCLRLKSLEITVDMRRRVEPAFVYVNRGEPMPNVVKEMWGQLETFYRQLGALKELEVLNLKIRSKEVTWLDEGGHVRKGGEYIRRLFNYVDDDYYGVGVENDTFSVDDTRGKFNSSYVDNLEAKRADASFPGLLSLGGPRRPETPKTVGQKELEWILAHWPKLEVIELLPALKDGQGKVRRLFPVDMSPPHTVWLQQQRPGLCIIQEL